MDRLCLSLCRLGYFWSEDNVKTIMCNVLSIMSILLDRHKCSVNRIKWSFVWTPNTATLSMLERTASRRKSPYDGMDICFNHFRLTFFFYSNIYFDTREYPLVNVVYSMSMKNENRERDEENEPVSLTIDINVNSKHPTVIFQEKLAKSNERSTNR